MSNALPRLPSRAEFVLLSLLEEHGPCYGLQLVSKSNGTVKKGGVYVLLGRLQEKGLVVSETPDRPKGQKGLPRPVYTITPLGKQALAAYQFLASMFGPTEEE